jgi:hypothetical protein
MVIKYPTDYTTNIKKKILLREQAKWRSRHCRLYDDIQVHLYRAKNLKILDLRHKHQPSLLNSSQESIFNNLSFQARPESAHS